MRVDAIIQARMTSTRLPGKVLAEVLGRPLLSYQLERLRRAELIGRVIVATTTNATDDPVADWAGRKGVDVFRGSEPDVLDRYHQAAKEFGCEHVMRITADCPLIDPGDCDRVVRRYFEKGLDYIRTGQTFAEGLDCEIISGSALERSWREAKLDFEREHVTAYVRHHADAFATGVYENTTDDSRYRITVDTPEDFDVVRAVLEGLYPEHGAALGMEHVRSFFDEHPEIYAVNAAVERNEARKKAAARGEVPEQA